MSGVCMSLLPKAPRKIIRIGLITTATLRRLDREVQHEHALEGHMASKSLKTSLKQLPTWRTLGVDLRSSNPSRRHNARIKIEDGGNPSLSSLTRVLVSIIDENDNDPEFHLSPYLCPVLEISTADPSLVLCQVVASDADTGPSGDVTYSFGPEKGSDLFTINPKTGAIYAKQKLLAGESYDFIVQATDKGIPSRSSSVRVKVDISPRPPASSRPPVCKEIENLAAVPENDPVYQAVAFLSAEDPDGDKVWYSIVGGNTDDAFMIHTPSGTVYVARHLDWEKKSNYNLNISITDGINIIYQQV
ncbi:protocadherin Fat 1 [Trichonephila clavipes]|nr:protocadherin Fat 1 [Trichonephila clavipes]